MEQVTAASILVVGPPSNPAECIAHDTRGDVKLPKTTVDVTTTSLKDAAQDLAKRCPAVNEYEFTTCSEKYSYTFGGAAPTEKTVHVFLVVATDRGREQDGYRWVPLENPESEFTYGGYVIQELKRDLHRCGLDDLGVDVSSVSESMEMSVEARAEKVDQDTTLFDF
jgi:hypothetical protein